MTNYELFFCDENKGLRKYLPTRLPRHETAWAMAVHKSQGSEFEQVLLVLSVRDIPLITRELIYTGITRARKDLDIWVGEYLLKKTISRRISCKSRSGRCPAKSPQRDISQLQVNTIIYKIENI
jgi:exodeoxyribonuclease V alpha subunit